MVFRPKTLDYELSPYTGLTRESWLEAAEYMLTGIFQNIKTMDDPVVMPRKETEITYPHYYSSPELQEAERKAEMFEGLTRSFFIAAPLMKNKPQISICGYPLSEYYKKQVLRSCTREDEIYVGTYEDLQKMTNYEDPYRAFQQTVETCALVICLWISKEQIWDTYTKEEKDKIAEFLTGFAHANTVPQNWRLFNMLDMAFLHMEGYPIDEEIMMDHAQAILNYYAGDGWYRDGHCFDYYSCWAFNVYGPLWNQWYGYENMPDIAARFEANSNKLMETYADFFDRDGFTNMWGRSNIYRNAATSAFDGNFFLRNSKADPGRARRVCSGSLLQFLTREDFLYKGVPTLGFYGQFSPLVQGYSCAESPFWLGKAFLCLDLPADHPFWTAKENNGTWEQLKGKEVKETVLDGPALCFTNHEANGETILRTGKIVKNTGDFHAMWNYSKLCYNTKYPWESTPGVMDIHAGKVETQQYVLEDIATGKLMRANVTLWCGSRDGVLYRRQFFDYNLEQESMWIQAMNLADFPVENGIIRVDKHRLFRRPVKFTLGAYGFPDNGTKVTVKNSGSAKAIILKGKNYTGCKKQLAMTVYDGWQDLKLVHSVGTNPDSENSIVVYAESSFNKQYGGHEPYVMISQVLTKESTEDFSDEELFPIQSVQYEDMTGNGVYGNTIVTLKNGTVKKINFEEMEARLTL
ncbi:MAG: DUF2264 domain-containing protein [Lachnospiraceae bacterium]|nr:DUF2264 domain-containing protein [Lachnospiraceae bacterium]